MILIPIIALLVLAGASINEPKYNSKTTQEIVEKQRPELGRR